MRILYGVAGEGVGHATRARVVVEHLASRGHLCRVLAIGRAFQYLKRFASDVQEVQPPTLTCPGCDSDRVRADPHDVLLSPRVALAVSGSYFEHAQEFDPQAVLTDFDPFASLVARRRSLPMASVDTQQLLARCEHPPEITEGLGLELRAWRAFIEARLPDCAHHFVSSLASPSVRPRCVSSTTLVPPILRPEILDAKTSRGSHVLVYQARTGEPLLPVLKMLTNRSFVVYGLHRDAVEDNCELKTSSEVGFVKDLASARAVMTQGGLGLMHESLWLRKPVFAAPVRSDIEYTISSRYLQQLRLGIAPASLEPDTLEWFLQQEARYVEALSGYEQAGNGALWNGLDAWLSGVAAGG